MISAGGHFPKDDRERKPLQDHPFRATLHEIPKLLIAEQRLNHLPVWIVRI